MNRAVASIPSGRLEVAGMKDVMLYSDEWSLQNAKMLLEQWCLKNDQFIGNELTSKQKEILNHYYNTISKYVVDNKLCEKPTTVYFSFNFIQQQFREVNFEVSASPFKSKLYRVSAF